MKTFLKNIFAFTGLLILYLSSNYFINLYIISKKKFSLKQHTWIIGDSHPMTALNPELIPNSRNFAQPSEPYIVTFLKLKQFLKFGKPDTIILGFGFHNLSDFNDHKFSDEQWSNEMFKRTYSFLSLVDIQQFDVNYKSYFNTIIKNEMVYPNNNHFNYLGKFKKTKHEIDTLATDYKSTIDRHFKYKDTACGVSELSLSYLDSIISLSEKINAVIILVNAPVHKIYFRNIPEIFKTEFIRVAENYKAHGISILDFSVINFPDKYFFNYDHLNYNGACELSKQFVKTISAKGN